MVAEACLADTLDAVAACGAPRKIVALDGEVGAWLPPGLEVIAQRGETFAERLAHAWAQTGGPGIQIGMDTPQVGAGELDALLAMLATSTGLRAVLGPAADGGWWAIGLPGLAPGDPEAVFTGVATSTARTGADQLRRLRRLGYDVALARRHRDIDQVEDLWHVAADIPASRTAAVARRLLDRGAAGPPPGGSGNLIRVATG